MTDVDRIETAEALDVAGMVRYAAATRELLPPEAIEYDLLHDAVANLADYVDDLAAELPAAGLRVTRAEVTHAFSWVLAATSHSPEGPARIAAALVGLGLVVVDGDI